MAEKNELQGAGESSGGIGDGITCIVIGLLFFVGALGLFYWNEGRKDVADVLETSVVIEAANPAANSGAAGELVSATGPLTSSTKVGDRLFLMPGDYLAVQRIVEMYAWVQTQRENQQKTVYRYHREWQRDPRSGENFTIPEGHLNPPKAIDFSEVRANNANVGAYGFDALKVELPEFKDLKLTKDNTHAMAGAVLADSNYIFKGRGSLDKPETGDLRISYKVVEHGRTVTLMGKLDGEMIVPFDAGSYGTVFKLMDGEKGTAVEAVHKSFSRVQLIFRAIALVLMWIGFFFILGPPSAYMNVQPVGGTAGNVVIGVLALLYSLGLSYAAIAVLAAGRNMMSLGAVLAAGIVLSVITFVIFKAAKPKQTA